MSSYGCKTRPINIVVCVLFALIADFQFFYWKAAASIFLFFVNFLKSISRRRSPFKQNTYISGTGQDVYNFILSMVKNRLSRPNRQKTDMSAPVKDSNVQWKIVIKMKKDYVHDILKSCFENWFRVVLCMDLFHHLAPSACKIGIGQWKKKGVDSGIAHRSRFKLFTLRFWEA